MDKDGDGEVNCVEFQLFMLRSMGKVKGSDLALLREQFIALDVTGDGVLNADDITDETEANASRYSTSGPAREIVSSGRKVNV